MEGFNWKFVAKVTGFILIIESLFLFISTGVSYYYQEDIVGLLASGLITFAVGLLLALKGGIRDKIKIISKRESYFAVALSWFSFALFGALPFFLSTHFKGFTDAFFESASGITTTGASILSNVEILPYGLIFWRSLLQWLGGMGIIVFSLALMPLIGGGAAQLFDAEASGLGLDRFRPKVAQMAKRLWAIYLALTTVLIGLLYLGPMNLFDAVCHAFSTISTGGFSTKQSSIAFWDSFYVEGVTSGFMILAAINFTLIYFTFKGQPKKLLKNEEVHWFLAIILIAVVLMTFSLAYNGTYPFIESLRNAFFQVSSVITTTGFATAEFSQWGSFCLVVFVFLMIVCGCAGSTSGGLKVVRVIVLAKDTLAEFKRLIHPRAIIPVRLNGNAISFSTVQRLLAFVFLYIAIIFISWAVLSMMGIPFIESFSAGVSSLGNVGPAFGSLGPMDSYANIPALAKWYLALLMIIGRLELFTVLILFTPGFWKR